MKYFSLAQDLQVARMAEMLTPRIAGRSIPQSPLAGTLWAVQRQVSPRRPFPMLTSLPLTAAQHEGSQPKGTSPSLPPSAEVWERLGNAPSAQLLVRHACLAANTSCSARTCFLLSVPVPLPHYPPPTDYGWQMFHPVFSTP